MRFNSIYNGPEASGRLMYNTLALGFAQEI